METTKKQIKVLSELIRKYKLENDMEKVKELQSIGLDLACDVLIESDKDKFFSFTKGEFVSYKRKQ
mgnify:CR=1 FL=1|jgi:hypothetical protein|tara:strand:+ start:421 stop:618 length:198 start_codon:yes stop_codon:yes gene_type:complete